MTDNLDLIKFSEEYYEEMLDFTRRLGVIPAPSGEEGERAQVVLSYLKSIGAKNAYIDSAKNVICTVGELSDDTVVFMAHTDIVFPKETPLDIKEDDDYLRFPGVTDDVARLAVMLGALKYILDKKITPRRTLMFVANSSEEGLGNLKGARQIFKDFGDKIRQMYTFDAMYNSVINDSVGSHRYLVTAKTEGGHSYDAFGNRSAINVLAGIINDIYSIEVPKRGESKTTYNVGTVSGGTSVNTIAEDAAMLVEYRSDNAECLAIMKEKYLEIFERARKNCLELKVELVGERPCKVGVDEAELARLTKAVVDIQHKYTGLPINVKSGSTDCNVPHSMGIPAVCVGVCDGGGTHTREEWLLKPSLKRGFAIAAELILKCGGKEI